MSNTIEKCAVFYLCDNPATTTYDALPVGIVPACQRCADKMHEIGELLERDKATNK